MSNPFKSLERSIKSGINSLGDEVKRAIRNLGNEVQSGVRQAGTEVKGGIEQAGEHVKSGVRHVGDEVKSDVRAAARTVKDEVLDEIREEAGKIKGEIRDHVPEVLKDAEEEIEEAAEAAVREVIKVIQSGTLNKAIDILQVAVPASAKLKLGPVSFDIANINQRIDEVQHWAKAGVPTDVDGVKNIVQVLGPTSCTVDLTAYVVTPLGLEMTWETEEFLRRLEDIWHRI